MNQDQVLALVRSVMLIVGPLLVAHGTINQDDWATLQNGITTFVGALLTVGPIIWAMFANTQKAAISKIQTLPAEVVLKEVAKMPEVRQVKVSTDKLAEAVPSDKVVHAP